MRFSIDFFSLLAWFSSPTCLPKPVKIHQKSMLRGNPSWASIFDGFLIDFWCQLQPHNFEKSLKIHLFYNSFCKIGLSKLASIFDPILVPTCLHFPFKKSAFPKSYRFFVDFGANMPPFSFPKPSKIQTEIDPKRHQFFDWFLHRFFIDFCSFWEANLGPCWPHFRSKWEDRIKSIAFRFSKMVWARSWDPTWGHVGQFFA